MVCLYWLAGSQSGIRMVWAGLWVSRHCAPQVSRLGTACRTRGPFGKLRARYDHRSRIGGLGECPHLPRCS
ncbi:hypothetical protein F5883DRAFT_557631 [Diaporthe sp. PMI_573]|nr:hypothetical protein F5883DRAFT_557631 [Diaporthaceae sp. PMI_573]